jgi:hypothetical protein
LTELLVIVLVLAGLFYALHASSNAKTAANRQAQTGWREAVRKELDLADFILGVGAAIGFDKSHGKIAVVQSTGAGHWIPIEGIRGVELHPIYETSETTLAETSTNRGSQLLGAAVGGAVAGPAGLVVGGLSGKTSTVAHTSSDTYLAALELRLKLRSDDMPGRKLRFEGAQCAVVEKFADRLAWEVEKRAPGADGQKCHVFETLQAPAQPANVDGWWTRTFG